MAVAVAVTVGLGDAVTDGVGAEALGTATVSVVEALAPPTLAVIVCLPAAMVDGILHACENAPVRLVLNVKIGAPFSKMLPLARLANLEPTIFTVTPRVVAEGDTPTVGDAASTLSGVQTNSPSKNRLSPMATNFFTVTPLPTAI